MKLTLITIRGLLLLAIAVVFFRFHPKPETEIPDYFQSDKEYYKFLEDIEGPGQASWKDFQRTSDQPNKNPAWDKNVIRRVISLRSAAHGWTDAETEDFANYIVVMSYRYRIPPPVVLALIEVESRFRKEVVSEKGAVGLMQLKPSTAGYISKKFHRPWAGPKSLRDPKQNIELGLMYLSYLSKRFQRPNWVFSAYNIGPVALKNHLYRKDPLRYSYFRKIMRSYRLITEQINPVATASL